MRSETTFVVVAIFASVACMGCQGAGGTSTPGDDAGNSTPDGGAQPQNDTGGDPPDPTRDAGVRDVGGSPGPDGGAPTDDMNATGTPDVSEPPVDLGACSGAGFGEDVEITAIAGTTASNRIYATANPSGAGALVGWSDGAGIHVTHVDAAGAPFDEQVVAGQEIFGLAASATGHAALVSRAPDILALVIWDAAGAVVSDQTVIGDVDHGVTENEWFGPLIRHARLIASPDGWVAYYPVQRLWNDGIAHYGDQLRVYTPDGSSFQPVWGWGCSHSMDLRISHNGDRLGPVCASDCYPSKGVHFNHRGGELYPDASGSNCAGGYGTTIGGSIPIPGGFWAAFTAVDDRESADVALVKIEGTSPQQPIWLTADATNDTDLNAVGLDEGVMVAWNAGGTNRFVLVNSETGAVVEGPISVEGADLGRSSDFFRFGNGDAGWAQRASDGSIALARVRSCP